MSQIKVRCVSRRPYLQQQSDGSLLEGSFAGEITSLTLGKVYDVLQKEHGYLRIVDDSGDDYLYPESLFEPAVGS